MDKLEKFEVLLRKHAVNCCGKKGQLDFMAGYMLQLIKDLDQGTSSIDEHIKYLTVKVLATEKSLQSF